MILTGPEIRKRVEAGEIRIDPFDPAMLNPASIDLTLGEHLVQYRQLEHEVLDPFAVNPTVRTELVEMGGEYPDLIIRPGMLYLMHTRERVWARSLVSVVDGKSSLGRLGVSVHQTAGYVDPGFDGQLTLEVTCIYPTRLRFGMRIAQLRFHEVVGEVEPYAGRYVGEAATGAVAARPLE